jgi:hypothetical protein
MAALKKWRFGPARLNGQPVEIVSEVSTEFRLD